MLNKDIESIVYFKTPYGFEYTSPRYLTGEMRDMETLLLIDPMGYEAALDQRYTVQMYGMLGFVALICVSIMLLVFVLTIEKTVAQLVLNPLESMFEKVEVISRNPMLASDPNFAKNAGVYSRIKADKNRKSSKLN
jgi:hypothetical protein